MKTAIKTLVIVTLLITTHLVIAQEKPAITPDSTKTIFETIKEIYTQDTQSDIYTSSRYPKFYSSRDKINYYVSIRINLDEYGRANCFDIYDGMRKTNAWKQISSDQKILAENIEYFRNLSTTINNARPLPRTTTRRSTSSGQNQPSLKPNSERVDMGNEARFFASSKEDAIYLAAALLEYLEEYKNTTISAINEKIQEYQNEIVNMNEKLEQLKIEHEKYRKRIDKEYGFDIDEDKHEREEALKEAKEWGAKITITEVELIEVRARLEETKKQKEIATQMALEAEHEINSIRRRLESNQEKDVMLEEQINVRMSRKQKMNEITLSLSEKIIDLNIDQAGLIAKSEKMAHQKYELEYYPMTFNKYLKANSLLSDQKKSIANRKNSIKSMQKSLDTFKSIIADDIYVTKSKLSISITPIIWEEE